MNRLAHKNSLAAYWTGQEGMFGHREQVVLDVIKGLGRASDREVMIALGKTDPNYCRPRITQLLKAGVLEECGTQLDPVTGRHVRQVRIKADPRQPQAQFNFAAIADMAHRMREDLKNDRHDPIMRGVVGHQP